MNCRCQPDSDLRVVCQPIDDYRKLKKYSNGLKYDFRKCPQRFNYAMEFVLKHYEYVQLIKNAQTKTGKKTPYRRFVVSKRILREKYRFSSNDAFTTLIIYRSKTNYKNIIDCEEENEEDSRYNRDYDRPNLGGDDFPPDDNTNEFEINDTVWFNYNGKQYHRSVGTNNVYLVNPEDGYSNIVGMYDVKTKTIIYSKFNYNGKEYHRSIGTNKVYLVNIIDGDDEPPTTTPYSTYYPTPNIYSDDSDYGCDDSDYGCDEEDSDDDEETFRMFNLRPITPSAIKSQRVVSGMKMGGF